MRLFLNKWGLNGWTLLNGWMVELNGWTKITLSVWRLLKTDQMSISSEDDKLILKQ